MAPSQQHRTMLRTPAEEKQQLDEKKKKKEKKNKKKKTTNHISWEIIAADKLISQSGNDGRWEMSCKSEREKENKKSCSLSY